MSHTQTTEWMTCGVRKRRAHITAPTAEQAARAVAHYDRVTKDHMSTESRIDRAIALHREHRATTRHEYDPE